MDTKENIEMTRIRYVVNWVDDNDQAVHRVWFEESKALQHQQALINDGFTAWITKENLKISNR
jgi:hypothetical protein